MEEDLDDKLTELRAKMLVEKGTPVTLERF
jgi:hypothetical protein